MKPERDKDGKLPAFAWPGGYPIIYICDDCATLCADCASCAEGRIDADIHWEGEPEICCDCGQEIESAYGVPEQ